jgi:predicted glycosyltransferase
MRIWFDADNAPHVLIMRPLADALRQQGHEVRFTARDRTETCRLLELYGLSYARVGGAYRNGLAGKALGTMRRAVALVHAMRAWHPDVSFGHGSRALPPASRWLGVPSVTMYDYEWVNPVLFNWCCAAILLPECIGERRCREARIRGQKVRFFPGLKEELYLGDRPLADGEVVRELGLRDEAVRVLLRPPATTAHYHNPESERILAALLKALTQRRDVQLVFVPRTPEQRAAIPATAAAQVIVPQKVYDGPSLIAAMDAVIGGGGTMTREAAVLGVPAYSFFRGRNGRVDETLEQRGLLVRLDAAADVAEKLWLVKRSPSPRAPAAAPLIEFVTRTILASAQPG